VSTMKAWFPAAIVCFLLSAAWAVTKGAEHIPERKPLQPLRAIPLTLGSYSGRDVPVDPYVKKVLEPTDMLFRTYTDGSGATVGVFMTYHGKQTSEFHPHSPKLCMPGSGWFAAEVAREAIPLGDGRFVNVVRSVYERSGEREVFFYWFQTGRRTTANEYLQKVWMIADGLTRHRTDVAFVRLSTTGNGHSAEQARERLVAFLQAFMPHLDSVLPE